MKWSTTVILVCAALSGMAPTCATQPDPEPTHREPVDCSTICNGAPDGTCCFDDCVCRTDPDPDVRTLYCSEWYALGCDHVS